MTNWRRLLWLCTRMAASRTFCTAGKSRPMRMAMMAITTSSSTSVKPRHHRLVKILGMSEPPKKRNKVEKTMIRSSSRREARSYAEQISLLLLMRFSLSQGEKSCTERIFPNCFGAVRGVVWRLEGEADRGGFVENAEKIRKCA